MVFLLSVFSGTSCDSFQCLDSMTNPKIPLETILLNSCHLFAYVISFLVLMHPNSIVLGGHDITEHIMMPVSWQRKLKSPNEYNLKSHNW